MSRGRRAEAAFKFNGKSVTKTLKNYIESVSYTDVASGSSDSLDISLQNIDENWLRKWYPKKGDSVVGSFIFHDWKKQGDTSTLPLGVFTLDEIKLTGGPLRADFGCVAIPSAESFKTRERTKTWKSVTVKEIGAEIAGRYKLGFSYEADDIKIETLEQSDEADSSFLSSLCDKYDLSMKVYAETITIYDQGKFESKGTVATIIRTDWVDDRWTYTDTLAGIYTGARISHKKEGSDEEISIYVGLKAENAPKSRVLKITETADDVGDAYRKAAAKVNESNRDATTLKGDIFPNVKICAGVTVKVKGLGKADGKYFVDKSTMTISSSGTTHSIEMHKCQPRLNASP